MALALAGVAVIALWPVPPASAQASPLVDAPVTSVSLADQHANNSPQMTVDPTAPDFVALASRFDALDFGCALHVSGDAGRSWLPAVPVRKLPAGADKCYAPEIAFGPDGTLYFLFVGLAGKGNEPMGVFLTTSSNRGLTFSRPRLILGPQHYMVRMAIDPQVGQRGRIHLVWLRATSDPPLGGMPSPPNPIMSAHSDDGGKRFSEPVQISDPERRLVVAPALALAPDGTLHVVYFDLVDDLRDYYGLEGPPWEGTWTLVATRSVDGGETFDRGVVVDDAIVPGERVMLIFTMPPATLAAGRDGTAYVAWADAREGDWDVLMRRSYDGAQTWSAPERVNDEARGEQYLPRLSLADSGRLDVVFYDRRRDPHNVRNDVHFTYSDDAGTTFAPSIRVNSESFDSRTGARYPIPSAAGLVESGSRLALLSGDDSAIAAWPDGRNVPPGYDHTDIYAAVIAVSSDEGPEWAMAAAALVVVAVAGFCMGRVRRARSQG